MRKYSRLDLSPLPWSVFGEAYARLGRRVDAHVRREGPFHALVPILRSGAIPGGMLAVRLGLTVVLPVQLKWSRRPARVETLLPLPLGFPLPPAPQVIVCDVNTSSGETAREAVRQVRHRYPAARVCFATVARVHGGPEAIEGADAYLHGIETDEGFVATEAERRTLGLRPGATLFPWERARDELAELNGGT
jgi:hypothetical protein